MSAYISIHLMLMLILGCTHCDIQNAYFNTSHVNVNRRRLILPLMNNQYFNTSHVNVNRRYDNLFYPAEYHFNTSHVNVNRCNLWCNGFNIAISIHLMLMLIKTADENIKKSTDISIHLMLMLIVEDMNEVFMEYMHFNTSHVNVNQHMVLRGTQ